MASPIGAVAAKRIHPSERGASFPYLRQLDALRAFAAIAVLVAHYVPASEIVGFSGAIGVRVFFAISGFLITGILLTSRRAVESGQSAAFALRQFYARRFLRIFPLYYLVVFVTAAFGISDARQAFWWYVSYTVNFRVTLVGDWIGLSHFWSLAAEEQFYLFWPLVILFVGRRRLVLVVTAVIVMGPLSRAILVVAGANAVQLEAAPPSCLDALGLGALLALSWNMHLEGLERRLVWAGLWFGVPAVFGLTVCNLCGALQAAYGVLFDFAVAICSVSIVAKASRGFEGLAGRLLEWRPLQFIGTISYGLYVYHYVVGEVVGWSTVQNRWAVAPATLATFAIAFVSWFFYERPINQWKHRFPYCRPA
jgi:peptidoglycan/LPS O-acetylase OafA/YrhL